MLRLQICSETEGNIFIIDDLEEMKSKILGLLDGNVEEVCIKKKAAKGGTNSQGSKDFL